jgi:hypothetical protein
LVGLVAHQESVGYPRVAGQEFGRYKAIPIHRYPDLIGVQVVYRIRVLDPRRVKRIGVLCSLVFTEYRGARRGIVLVLQSNPFASEASIRNRPRSAGVEGDGEHAFRLVEISSPRLRACRVGKLLEEDGAPRYIPRRDAEFVTCGRWL